MSGGVREVEVHEAESDQGQGRQTGQRGVWLAVLGLVLVVGLWAGLRQVVPPSARTLEDRVAGEAGVAGVSVVEPEGDDGIPFQTLAREVTITMRADATASQVADVLHAYDDDIDDGDVGSISLSVPHASGVAASLVIGTGVHADDAAVDEMFAAISDPLVQSYERTHAPVGTDVRVEIDPASMATVIDYADRFGLVGQVGIASVESGGLVLDRDLRRGARTVALRERREQVAVVLDGRYRLDGVLVADGVPFTVVLVDPAARRSVRGYLAGLPRSHVGAYRVTASASTD